MKRAKGPELLALEARVQRWRKHRESKISRIPREIWDEAVGVVAIEGVHATAKALRFEYYALKKRVEQAQAEHKPVGSRLATVTDTAVDEPPKTTFVQVQMPHSDTEQCNGRMVIELTGRGGDRMRIDAADAASVDVVGMVQAFWSRAS